MKVSLVFDPTGARVLIEPESEQDKALLAAFGAASRGGTDATVIHEWKHGHFNEPTATRIELRPKPEQTVSVNLTARIGEAP